MKPTLNDTQPALIRGGVGALVAAVLAFLTAWGVDISPDRQTAILGLVAVVGPYLTAWWIKRNVYCPATHKAAVEAAREQVYDRRPSRKPKS